jgi:hypothetical protein
LAAFPFPYCEVTSQKQKHLNDIHHETGYVGGKHKAKLTRVAPSRATPGARPLARPCLFAGARATPPLYGVSGVATPIHSQAVVQTRRQAAFFAATQPARWPWPILPKASADTRSPPSPPANFAGKNVSILMPEPHRSVHDGYMRAYLRTGHAKIIGFPRTLEHRRKDGSIFTAELAVTECR